MPTAPAAPVLFTTTTGFLRIFSIDAATGRAVKSATPPGGNGATIVIGRSGNFSWARAAPSGKEQATTRSARLRFMWALLFLRGQTERAAPIGAAAEQRQHAQEQQAGAGREHRGGDRAREKDRVVARRHRQRLAEAHLQHRRQDYAENDRRGLEVELA